MGSLTRKDFRLQMLLGLGRMAQVYLARAPSGEEVALKIPKKEVREDPILREAFAREVLLSLRFRHPYLVRGLYGEPYGEGAFLALEYFPEGSLETRLLQGPLPLGEALKALRMVGEALLYLHGQGFLHQDVKPGNIFLQNGAYKLGDLGALRPLTDRSQAYAGSPYYTAPELHLGHPPSPRSDAYSFGVLAYELLTGRRPFQGDSLEALKLAHLLNPPPPTRLPTWLDQGLARLLDKDPKRRWGVGGFLEHLARHTR